MKVCTRCGELKELTCFHKKLDKLDSHCKVCKNKSNNKYNASNREALRSYASDYVKANKALVSAKSKARYFEDIEASKESNRKNYLKYQSYKTRIKRCYHVEPEYIQYLMNQQKGCCGCCGESLVYPDSKKQYHIDHDHTTLKVRGLLCTTCNTGIGHLGDNLEGLHNAIKYLRSCL